MKTINEGTLYEGWAGDKARTWHTDSELKQMLMQDFKKAGIKATVRFPKAGYLTSLVVTIKVSADEIMSFDEYRQKTGILDCVSFGSWVDYKENGKRETIHIDKLLDGTELWDQARITKLAIETRYADLRDSLERHGTTIEDIMKPEAIERYHAAVNIVRMYNRDCSNSQIDYFDRDIYDRYKLKVV